MKRFLSVMVAVVLTLAGRLTPAEESSARSVLQPYVERHALAGVVVLVADRDKVLLTDTAGFADIGANKAMPADALFWIASQSKPMTAAAVMILVDEGKISLDDPVAKYLPEFNAQRMIAETNDTQTLLQKPAHAITIRETLSHMTGLPFKSAIEEPTLDGLPLSAAVRSYAMTPLQWEPGTKYQYSNAGINTAARVIEVVAKMPYEDFMQKRLFDPLGMKDTTFWPNEEQVSRLAKSYRPNAAKDNLEEFPISQLIYPLTDRHHRFPMPAGGLFSTAQDTAKFCQMLLRNGEWHGQQILSESAVKELSKRQTPESVKESYGLGFSVGGDSFGHGGAHSTNMDIRPKDGVVFVWMVQHAGFPKDGGEAQGSVKTWAMDRLRRR